MSQYFPQIIKITEDYLGPASERFIRRTVDFHLQKDPSSLTADDASKMAEWVRAALGLITQDKKTVDEAALRIKKVAENKLYA